MEHETDDRLSELLLAWEESVAAGAPLSASQLCGNSSELVVALEREIALLKSVDPFMRARNQAIDLSERETLLGPAPLTCSASLPCLPGYEILEEIGRGGMGIVYKARQQTLGRFVAIKTLAGSRWGQPAFLTRLRREAKALSQLNHRHVVRVFDIVETNDSLSLVLELVEGDNLADRLKGMPMAPREAAEIALTLARTMTSVHARGLLHRDLKPANVLVDRDGEIKIADFGLAKEVGNREGQTVTGELFGSPNYMAPEQANGRNIEIDTRTDVYALGATLYELLSGRPPFVGASAVDTLNQVLDRDPIGLRVLIPNTPRDLETICLKCLEKKRDRRFGSMNDLADELDRYLKGVPIHSRPIRVLDRFVRKCKRQPAMAGMIGLSATALFAFVSLVIASNSFHQRNLIKHNNELETKNNELVAAEKHANEMRQIAEANAEAAINSENQAKDWAYASDLNRAAIAWKQEDTRELTDLLDRHIPKPGDFDRRGFEWWYLKRQSTIASRVLLETGSAIYSLRPSPDGRLLASAGKDAVVRLFIPETGEVVKEITTGQIEVNGIAFVSKGTELATAGDDGAIRIWNLDTGCERVKIQTPFQKAYDLRHVQGSNDLFACGKSHLICVFDIRTGGELYRLDGHTATVECLGILPDGMLASASNDHSIRIWDLTHRSERMHFHSPGNVEAVLPVQESRLLTGDSNGVLRTIDIKENHEISSVKHLDRIGSLAFNPPLLAVGDKSGRIRLWKIDDAGRLQNDGLQTWQAHRDQVNAIRWVNQGTELISAGADGRVVRWTLTAPKRNMPATIRRELPKGSWPFSTRSANILLPHVPHLKKLMSHGNSHVRLRPRRPGQTYSQFCVSPDGKSLAVLNLESEVELFGIPEKEESPIDANHLATWNVRKTLRIIGFRPDSQSLVVADQHSTSPTSPEDSRIWLLGVPTFEEQEQIPIERTRAPALSPDGKHIVFATPEELMLWDILERKIVWRTPQADIRHIVYSPDGKTMATVLATRPIILWNSENGTKRTEITHHRSLVQRLVFSPDCRTLVTAAEDRSINFSHVVTGQKLLEFTEIGNVIRLEFSEDGKRLIAQTTRVDWNDPEIFYDRIDLSTIPDEIHVFDPFDLTRDGVEPNCADTAESIQL